MGDIICRARGSERASKANEYRERAKECEVKAAAARDKNAKRAFTDAAINWREMADQVDRMIDWLNEPPQSTTARTHEDSSSMNDSSEFKIRRWERSRQGSECAVLEGDDSDRHARERQVNRQSDFKGGA